MDVKDVVALVTALTSFVAAIGVILVKMQSNSNSQKIARTEHAVRDNTAATFQTQQDVLTVKDVADATHLLVDGAHSRALRGWADATQRVAELTNDPKDKLHAAAVANQRDANQVTGKPLDEKKESP